MQDNEPNKIPSLKKEMGNYRNLRPLLTHMAQEAVQTFRPRKAAKSKNHIVQVLDFFSGAGGTSLGFAALGRVLPSFKLLGGFDINAVSAATYGSNYLTPIQNRDIRELANHLELLDDVLEEVGYDKDKPLMLIGCAPCQGFSSHRKKHWSEKEDNRNSLVFSFSKIVRHLNPDIVLMENVPEFLSTRYWSIFSETKSRFESYGYTVKQNVYNAAQFGVPQERFRSIVVAMKKNFLLPSGFLDASAYRTVRDAIGKLPPVKAGEKSPDDPLHKSAAHKQRTIDIIRAVPHNGGNRPAGIGPACLDKVNGFYDVYGRLPWDKPSITITHYARNPASGRYSHPEQDRGLTAREAAALQSFPEGFVFTGKFDDIYRQIGEAVPPMLSAALAAHIFLEYMSVEPTESELSASPQPVEEPLSNSYSSVIAGIKTKARQPAMNYTCIDSFCGAGGLALGLQKAGFDIRYSFDIDEKCINTLHLNDVYFHHKAEVADISDMLGGALLKRSGFKRGELFLLAGGPPCQGFSVQRRGADRDIRNDLVLKYGKLVKELYPCFFVMENVSGIAGKRGKTILHKLIDTVSHIGYDVSVKLLNAQEYGVPQRRKRYIIVGKRGDIDSVYQYPNPIPINRTVRETIGSLPEPPEDGSSTPGDVLHRRDCLSKLNIKRLKALKPGEGRDSLPKELLAECHKISSSVIGHRRVYGRMAWDDVAPTITARFDSFTRGQFGHPEQLRSITLREGAMLQTFPDDYQFFGSKVDIARQIGNAIPPILAEAIGKSIIQCYQNRKTTK